MGGGLGISYHPTEAVEHILGFRVVVDADVVAEVLSVDESGRVVFELTTMSAEVDDEGVFGTADGADEGPGVVLRSQIIHEELRPRGFEEDEVATKDVAEGVLSNFPLQPFCKGFEPFSVGDAGAVDRTGEDGGVLEIRGEGHCEVRIMTSEESGSCRGFEGHGADGAVHILLDETHESGFPAPWWAV